MLEIASPPADLGGSSRTVEWICLPQLVNAATGEDNLTGGWQREPTNRGGVVGSAGLQINFFENGAAGGGAGNGGKGWVYHKGVRTLSMGIRQTAGAASAPNDNYCKGNAAVIVERRVGAWVPPLQAWDIVVVMARRTVPAAAITEDLGVIVEANTGVTGYPGGFIQNTGNNQAGWGVVYDGAAGGLRFIARNTIVGAALSESLPLSVNPGTDFVKVVMRLTGATATADASLRVIINDAVLVTRTWAAGTVLPNRTTYPAWGGAFRVFVRNADSGAGGACPLSIAYWAIRGADTEAQLIST